MIRHKSFELKVDRRRLEALIDKVEEERDRMFLIALFLTGARISEIVKRLRGSDIRVGEKGIMYVHLITLKRRDYMKNMPREVPIKISSEVLSSDFLSYVKLNPDVLFPFSRTTGWRIVKKHFEMEFPHFFRHARSTLMLREIPNFQFHDLKIFHNWSSQAMASVYVHGELKDVVNKMTSQK
jgi:integrase